MSKSKAVQVQFGQRHATIFDLSAGNLRQAFGERVGFRAAPGMDTSIRTKLTSAGWRRKAFRLSRDLA